MAKNSFGKILAGVTVIGAGVALGLAIFNKLDTIKRELDSDEFEDEFDGDEEDGTDFSETEYVTINPAAAETAGNNTDTAEEAAKASAEDSKDAE